jgi:hypothetical protein
MANKPAASKAKKARSAEKVPLSYRIDDGAGPAGSIVDAMAALLLRIAKRREANGTKSKEREYRSRARESR